MPSMMKNQPMKDNYVGGLEKSVARKVGDVMGANRKTAKMLIRGASNIADDASKMFVEKPAKMIAKKMKPFPPEMRQPKKTPKTPTREQPPYRKNKFSKPDKPMFGGKFGI